MERQVCPNCGTVQPGERRYCVSCGKRLDTDASEYIDSRLYFERKAWMNAAVAVLLVLAVGNVVLTVVFGHTHYVWIPFLCAVWFVFAAVVFAFPKAMYMVFGYIWAYGGHRHYRCWNCAQDHLPEDIDDPYPESIRRMFVVFAALSVVAVVGCVWFALDVSSFVIQPASSFTFPSDIEITPHP